MLSPNHDYEFADAVEIELPESKTDSTFVRRWNGSGTLSFDGKEYKEGGLLETSEIAVGGEAGSENASITMDSIALEDRKRYLENAVPAKATLLQLWRRKVKTENDWEQWMLAGKYEGRLSQARYSDGRIGISVQRVFDDVWRGDVLRWTASDQKRRMIDNPEYDAVTNSGVPKKIPNADDTGLDRADKVRRSNLLIGWQA